MEAKLKSFELHLNTFFNKLSDKYSVSLCNVHRGRRTIANLPEYYIEMGFRPQSVGLSVIGLQKTNSCSALKIKKITHLAEQVHYS